MFICPVVLFASSLNGPVTKQPVAPLTGSQYHDKQCPTLQPRFTTLAANCFDSHYLTSKSPQPGYK